MHHSHRGMYALSLVSFSNGLQLAIFYSTLWPYTLSVDPTLTVSFFGYITAVFSIGQCVSSILFGLWMDRSKSARSPLICGLSLMSISNVLYCLAQSASHGKWVILLSRIILGFGAGTVSITRALAPRAGKHSAQSIALVQCAYSLGCTVGLSLQFLFTFFGDGSILGEKTLLNMYTAAPLLLAVVNGLVILAVDLFLEETVPTKKTSILSVEFPAIPEVLAPGKRDNLTISMVTVTIFLTMLMAANIDSILSAYAEIMWGWKGEETVKNVGHFHTFHGVTQILVFFAVSTALSRHIDGCVAVVSTIAGVLLAVLFYLMTYPYPTVGDLLNCTGFDWCSAMNTINVTLFFVAFSVVLAMAFPIISISTNIIFCEATDKRHQGTLMGLLTAAANTAKVCGPLAMTSLFEQFGPKPIWLTMISLLLCCTFYWIFHLKRRC